MRLLIALALLAIVACSKKTVKPIDPEPHFETVEEVAKPSPIVSRGHQFTKTEPKQRQGATVYFGLDSDRLTRDIDTDHLLLAKRITVTGHACPLGTNAYNMALSIRRAEAIKRNLVKSGIPSEIITIEGKGETEVLPGDYSLSRRAVITWTMR